MQGGPWRAETSTRRGSPASPCAASWALVLAITLVMAALSGCAPMYHDAGYAEAADAGVRSRTRSKPRMPLPKAALLAPQAPPDCGEAMTADPTAAAADPRRMASTTVAEPASAAVVPPSPRVDPNATLALRIKLEYERECYRQAEARVRARLQELQGSVKETIKSVNRADQQGR